MHIPDGYLSPVFALSTGVVTVPAWGIAANRVRAVLDARTIPLLAIFSAFVFTIMMFNVPVFFGTTAHAVGGTLIAIVLGPWAAVIGVSTALIIQALFFGDGGVLAIFVNCLNMGVVLPFVGYYSYKLLAGNSRLLSTRRVLAAGMAGYIALTVAALLVGIELGVQPLLFSENGKALYSPYTLSASIPAMLLTHMLGASIVEGVVTALGLAYIQQHYPHYLTSLSNVVLGGEIESGKVQKTPYWQIFIAGMIVFVLLFFIAGLIAGQGNISRLFGADWSQVNWAEVGFMLLFVAVLAALLVPLAWFLLPRRIRNIGAAIVAFIVLTPLGLIAPGFAFGEGSVEDVQSQFSYIPRGLEQFANFFSAPLADYNIPLPFFQGENAPLWRAALGYEIAAIVGIVVLAVLIYGLSWLLRRFPSKDERARIVGEPQSLME